MPAPKTVTPAFTSIKNWIEQIHGAKEASVQGKTTHPSQSVDDGTMKPNQGAHFSEQATYVKKNVPAGGVESASETHGSETDAQLQIGTRKAPTGEDASTEDDFKDRPTEIETTKTKAPADAAVGPKYSFDLNTFAGVNMAAKAAAELANEIAANIAVINAGGKVEPRVEPKAAEATAAVQPAQDKTATATEQPTLDSLLGMTKDAADQAAFSVLTNAIKEAQESARRVADYLNREIETAQAHAQRSAASRTPDATPFPSFPMPAKTAAEGMPEEAPKDDPKPEADPVAAGGPDMGAAPEGPGGGDQEQILQQLFMALTELGITPEQLAAAAQSGMGGGAAPGPDMAGMGMGGDPAAMAGGMPPAGPAEMAPKIAAAVRDFCHSGKARYTEAKQGSPERAYRDELKNYIRELTRAGRK